MGIYVLLLCLGASIACADAAKILVIFPMAAYSHFTLGNKFVHLLAERGHEVTTIASFKDKNLPKSCREVHLSGFAESMDDTKMNLFQMEDINVGMMVHFMAMMGQNFTDYFYSHPIVQKLMKDPNEKFDVIIIEEFINEGMKALGYHFNAPVISVSTVGANSWVNRLVENPQPISYVPDLFLTYNGTMTFWQRLVNGAVVWGRELHDRFYILPGMDKITQKYLPGAPSVFELNRNVSLILMNSHVSTNQPVPHMPNMIEIGGYHVDPPKKLPDDLQKYLDGSKNGVVYFSMGSNLQSKHLPVELRDGILKAFSKLNMDVLWKFEDDVLPGQPKNVKILKWVPQQDVLAHPKVKLFITHGGLLSTIETIYHGIPIIGIPVFGDQKLNMANAVSNGFAVKIDYKSLSEVTLTAALNEVLKNPKYAENAKMRSALMHDRIVSPKDTAAYWIEYVIRHKGARHFRTAALDLKWYQLYSLDIIAFILAVIGGIFFAVSRIFKRKVKQEVTSKKKQL